MSLFNIYEECQDPVAHFRHHAGSGQTGENAVYGTVDRGVTRGTIGVRYGIAYQRSGPE
jgi:hypothetical protein